MVSAVDNVVEILFSFPFVVKDAIGSGVSEQFSDAFPTVGFPFNGAIGGMEFTNAIARMLSLTVGFQASLIGRIMLHGDEEKGLGSPFEKSVDDGKKVARNASGIGAFLAPTHLHSLFSAVFPRVNDNSGKAAPLEQVPARVFTIVGRADNGSF
jgi:hypothetical protein